jgi:hypothetical protein
MCAAIPGWVQGALLLCCGRQACPCMLRSAVRDPAVAAAGTPAHMLSPVGLVCMVAGV